MEQLNMIKKEKGGYTVKSATHKKSMGTYKSKADAEKRLAQVEAFKSMKKSGTLGKKKKPGHKFPSPKHKALDKKYPTTRVVKST
jgi:hypothetical protein